MKQDKLEEDILGQYILGKEEYEGLMKFFVSLFELAQKLRDSSSDFYITFITKRCYVLFVLFLDSMRKYSKDTTERPKYLPDNFDFTLFEALLNNYFVTDTALTNMSQDFAHYYRQNNRFPVIVVADELMIHGRAVNRLLHNFEKDIITHYVQEETSIEQIRQLKEKFSDAVVIRLYACNSSTILLLPQYKRHLSHCKECDAKDWRRLSMCFAQFIAMSTKNNVAFSWSFCSSQKKSLIMDKQEQMVGDFRLLRTSIQNVQEYNYIWLYPNEQMPKAVCTVRSKVSAAYIKSNKEESATQKQLFVPFIIFDHLQFHNIWRLHNVLISDIENAGFFALSVFLKRHDAYIEQHMDIARSMYYRWISETNELILNALLMKKFWNEVPEQVRNVEDIDYDFLTRNYVSFQVGKNREEICKALKDIWNWENGASDTQLEQYLNMLLEEAKPFIKNGNRFGNASLRVDWSHPISQKYVTYGVENSIAEIGYEAERHAYEHYTGTSAFSDETLSKWGDTHSLETLLEKCGQKLVPYLKEMNAYTDLYQIMAVIVHAMDYGLLGMNPVQSRHPCEDNLMFLQQKSELYTEQHAGEAALFIEPTRYRNFIPVLKQIMDWREDDYGNAKLDIYWFVKRLKKEKMQQQPLCETGEPYSILAENLFWFYQMVFWSGQRLSGWSFALREWKNDLQEQRKSFLKDLELQEEYLDIYKRR